MKNNKYFNYIAIIMSIFVVVIVIGFVVEVCSKNGIGNNLWSAIACIVSCFAILISLLIYYWQNKRDYIERKRESICNSFDKIIDFTSSIRILYCECHEKINEKFKIIEKKEISDKDIDAFISLNQRYVEKARKLKNEIQKCIVYLAAHEDELYYSMISFEEQMIQSITDCEEEIEYANKNRKLSDKSFVMNEVNIEGIDEEKITMIYRNKIKELEEKSKDRKNVQ